MQCNTMYLCMLSTLIEFWYLWCIMNTYIPCKTRLGDWNLKQGRRGSFQNILLEDDEEVQSWSLNMLFEMFKSFKWSKINCNTLLKSRLLRCLRKGNESYSEYNRSSTIAQNVAVDRPAFKNYIIFFSDFKSGSFGSLVNPTVSGLQLLRIWVNKSILRARKSVDVSLQITDCEELKKEW